MFSIIGDDILFNGVLVGHLVDTQPIGVRIEAERLLLEASNYDIAYDAGYEAGKDVGHDEAYDDGFTEAKALYEVKA